MYLLLLDYRFLRAVNISAPSLWSSWQKYDAFLRLAINNYLWKALVFSGVVERRPELSEYYLPHFSDVWHCESHWLFTYKMQIILPSWLISGCFKNQIKMKIWKPFTNCENKILLIHLFKDSPFHRIYKIKGNLVNHRHFTDENNEVQERELTSIKSTMQILWLPTQC